MNDRDLIDRLTTILGAAYRVRQPGTGAPPDAAMAGIDTVRAELRRLITDVCGAEPSRMPPRVSAIAANLPEGRIPGTRILVRHRRGARVPAVAVGQPARKAAPSPREAAESWFRAPGSHAAPACIGR